jgi:8-oxo-dGTP pyrophosphatase MutT (NUDIX family)
MQNTESNPWQTLASKIIYDNPWIRLREDQVIRPDGAPGIYGVVHFKNQAVGVLAVEDDGRIHLVGQFRYALDRYSWEIPEGGCGEGEEPRAAAERELLEETGLRAARWELLGAAHLSNSVTDEIARYYLATGLTAGEAQPEGTERIERRTVTFEEALRMVRAGEITDAISVMAILHYAVRLKSSTEGGGNDAVRE